MRTWSTYRSGRAYHRASGDNDACGGVSALLVLLLLLVIAPAAFIFSESAHRRAVAAFDEISETIAPWSGLSGAGALVHVAAARVEAATAADAAFGVRLSGALALRRETEYCQWCVATACCFCVSPM